MTLGRLRRSEFRISASRDAADQNVIRGRPRSNRVKHRVTPHVKALGDKDILGAAVRRITSELTERSFRLAHIVEDLAFDHDFRTCRDIELRGAASRDAIGLTKERADDLVFPHIRRIVKRHRAHVVDRVDTEGDDGRQRLAARLGAAMEFVHPPPRMQ